MGGTPDVPSPKEQARASDWENRQAEARQAARDAKAKAEQAAQNKKDWGYNRRLVDKKYNYLLGNLNTALSRLGYGGSEFGNGRSNDDPYGIRKYYLAELNERMAGYDPKNEDMDPNSIFRDVNLKDIIADITNTAREKLELTAKGKLGTDYGADNFSYDADNKLVDEILGQQQNDATEALKRALARGQLNQSAFDRATLEMNNAADRGRAELEGIGRGVIDKYRGGLSDYIEKIYGNIGDFDLRGGYKFKDDFARLDALRRDYQGRLRGDFMSAFGERDLFDPNKYISKGRNVSGYTGGANTTPNSGSNVGPLDNLNNRNTGNQGVF